MKAGGPFNARIEAHNKRVEERTRAWAVACVGTKRVRYWGEEGWTVRESEAKLWTSKEDAVRVMACSSLFAWLRLVRVEQCPGPGFPTSMGV